MNQSRKKIQNLLWGILLIGWITLLFIFSSQSYEQQSIQPLLHKLFTHEQLIHWLPDMTIRYRNSAVNSYYTPFNFIEFLFRKGAHIFVYATFASILFMFVRSFHPRKLFRAIAVTLIISFAIPTLDELNQLRSSERTGNGTDVLLDFTGACAGVIVCLIIIGVVALFRRKK